MCDWYEVRADGGNWAALATTPHATAGDLQYARDAARELSKVGRRHDVVAVTRGRPGETARVTLFAYDNGKAHLP